jgi:hypothetical protein
VFDTGIDTTAEMNLLVIGALYLDRRDLQSLRSRYRRRPQAAEEESALPVRTSSTIACKLLWRDKLGQISLAVTTLFWGAGATLQFIVHRMGQGGAEPRSFQGQHAAGHRRRRRRHRRGASGADDLATQVGARHPARYRHGPGRNRS